MRLFKQNNADSKTDRNISLVADGWTLIGHSSDSAFSIDDTKFIASDGTEYTWANAASQNKVYAYLAYWDSTPASASDRKYKYSSLSTLGMDDSNLQPKTGYWVYAWEAGTLNLPGAGGTINTTTYDYNKLRFHNGTDELNISEAGSEGWILTTLRKYGQVGTYPGGSPRYDFISITSGSLESWKGHFIWSNYDNITLIRQN